MVRAACGSIWLTLSIYVHYVLYVASSSKITTLKGVRITEVQYIRCVVGCMMSRFAIVVSTEPDILCKYIMWTCEQCSKCMSVL